MYCPFVMPAAGAILCDVAVANNGKVRLLNVQLIGPENSCNLASPLAPAATGSCQLKLTVNQAHFDSREANESPATLLTLNVTGAGTSNVTANPLNLTQPVATKADLALPITRSLTAHSNLDKFVVSSRGKLSAAHAPA